MWRSGCRGKPRAEHLWSVLCSPCEEERQAGLPDVLGTSATCGVARGASTRKDNGSRGMSNFAANGLQPPDPQAQRAAHPPGTGILPFQQGGAMPSGATVIAVCQETRRPQTRLTRVTPRLTFAHSFKPQTRILSRLLFLARAVLQTALLTLSACWQRACGRCAAARDTAPE